MNADDVLSSRAYNLDLLAPRGALAPSALLPLAHRPVSDRRPALLPLICERRPFGARSRPQPPPPESTNPAPQADFPLNPQRETARHRTP